MQVPHSVLGKTGREVSMPHAPTMTMGIQGGMQALLTLRKEPEEFPRTEHLLNIWCLV